MQYFGIPKHCKRRETQNDKSDPFYPPRGGVASLCSQRELEGTNTPKSLKLSWLAAAARSQTMVGTSLEELGYRAAALFTWLQIDAKTLMGFEVASLVLRHHWPSAVLIFSSFCRVVTAFSTVCVFKLLLGPEAVNLFQGKIIYAPPPLPPFWPERNFRGEGVGGCIF